MALLTGKWIKPTRIMENTERAGSPVGRGRGGRRIRAVTSRAWMVRLAALMSVGTFAVHQARYALGYRGEASQELVLQGHAYLIALGPLLAGVLMLALAGLIRRVARGGDGPAPRFGRVWAGATGALTTVYTAQELIEGAVASHHPEGIVGVAGHGGWVALPLAFAIGFAIALAMRGAGAAQELAQPRRPWRTPAALESVPAVPVAHLFAPKRSGAA